MEEKINFCKYSAYGNDYIVIDPNKNNFIIEPKFIEKICNRNFGIGSDGILLGPILDEKDFEGEKIISLRIFNSDGSEAEKSGNGLRIFSQYLLDEGYLNQRHINIKHLNKKNFNEKKLNEKNINKKNLNEEYLEDNIFEKEIKINTKGGIVRTVFHRDGYISIDMGIIEFYDENVEIEAFNENNDKDRRVFNGCYLSIGNPHFTIILDRVDYSMAKIYGKSIESNSFFANKTNVQFIEVLNKKNIKIEIFERGSGYTLASGSSACAAAATTFKKGLTDNVIDVHMPGGVINVTIDENYRVIQKGKVKKIFEGIFFSSTFLDKINN